MGVGNFDSHMGERQFWEIPQTNDNYDEFNNTAPRADVFFALSSSKVGDTLSGTYRMGNSFGGNTAAGEFGDDFRPRVKYWATVLRVMPGLNRDGIRYGKAMEIRVVQHVQWPLYDDLGITNEFDENNFEKRTFRFWFADGLGIVRKEQEQRFISPDQGDFIDHGYRAKTRVVGYKRPSEDPFATEGDVTLLFTNPDEFEGFASVDVNVNLGLGEDGANYKLVVLRPTKDIEGHVEDEGVTAQLSDTVNFQNRLPDRFASVNFTIQPTDIGHFLFRVYKWPSEASADPSSTAADVPEDNANLVGEVPFFIDGKLAFNDVFIELQKEGDTPSIMLFEGSGFSFLAGDFTPFDEPKRDFRYARQQFGSGVEMRLNKFLPDGTTNANRRIKEVFLEGNDLRERFKKILNGESSVGTKGLTSAGQALVLQPGKTYLYTGPGVESMKGVGKDRVLVLMGVDSKDDNSFSFVYVMKKINELQSFETFKNIQLNDRFDFEVQENFYDDFVQIGRAHV